MDTASVFTDNESEILFSCKENVIIEFEGKWMKLKSIMLSEVTQAH